VAELQDLMIPKVGFRIRRRASNVPRPEVVEAATLIRVSLNIKAWNVKCH
jgi:hypothetical protein